jgi:predicted transcriptional regulator
MKMNLADTLRKAIRDSGYTAGELSRATGVPQPTITRFLSGADMRLSRAQKLASHLGLTLAKHDCKKRSADCAMPPGS